MISCYKFPVKAYYVIQPRLTGEKINDIIDNTLQSAKEIFQLIESSYIYIPQSPEELFVEIQKKFENEKLPKGINTACTQYFVNDQLYNIVSKNSDFKNWHIDRELKYSTESQHTVDLKIYNEKLNFSVWIESDNARADQLYKKLWEKLPIILYHGNPASDFYVPFIYATQPAKFKDVNRITNDLIKTIEYNIRVQGIFTSFAVFSIDTISNNNLCNVDFSIEGENSIIKIHGV